MYCCTNYDNGSPEYKLKCVSTALMGSDLQCSSGELDYLLSAALLLLQSKVIKTQRVQKLSGLDYWSWSLSLVVNIHTFWQKKFDEELLFSHNI